MVEVLRIDSSNIGRIAADYELNGLPLPAYLRAAQLPWINHHYPYAHALLEGRRFLGWVQSFYADRVLDGRTTTICNLSSWWVMEEHRSASMRLMFAALRDAGDIPCTAHTPSGLAAQISTAMKFHVSDTERFGLPVPQDGPEAVGDADQVFVAIGPDAKKVFNDHRGMDIHHCLVRDGERSCYFVYLTRERFDLQVADLLYLDGDVEALSGRWRPPAGSKLAACQRLLVDRRFFGDRPPQAELINPFNPRFYKGPAELRPKIDYMYGEIPFYVVSLL